MKRLLTSIMLLFLSVAGLTRIALIHDDLPIHLILYLCLLSTVIAVSFAVFSFSTFDLIDRHYGFENFINLLKKILYYPILNHGGRK